jgi:phosphoglycerate dehydrogenase-like enzyme
VNRRLREVLQPFDCSFTVYARTSGDLNTPAELDQALPHADIVCAALPDLPETNGLINKERVDRFKPGAIFTNVGRGSLVDEPALIAALHAGRLGGAVLDVTCREPLPPDDPLWGSPRTILTQHTAGGWTTVVLRRLSVFGENLARYRAGKPLHNVVDWKRGY